MKIPDYPCRVEGWLNVCGELFNFSVGYVNQFEILSVKQLALEFREFSSFFFHRCRMSFRLYEEECDFETWENFLTFLPVSFL